MALTVLKIRCFIPMAEDTLELIPTDVGRPIINIRFNVVVKEIEKLIAEVITKLTKTKMDIQDNNGDWYELISAPHY